MVKGEICMDKELYSFYALTCAEQIMDAFGQLKESAFRDSILRDNDGLSYAQKLAKNSYFYVIAKKNICNLNTKTEELLGFISFYANYSSIKHGHISIVCIKNSHHGKGFGRALIELAKETSSSNGMYTLGVMCHKNNHAAQKFYDKMGFSFQKNFDEDYFELGTKL
jgi:ribosomal protein S18 acetylase RimI-like enzyme